MIRRQTQGRRQGRQGPAGCDGVVGRVNQVRQSQSGDVGQCLGIAPAARGQRHRSQCLVGARAIGIAGHYRQLADNQPEPPSVGPLGIEPQTSALHHGIGKPPRVVNRVGRESDEALAPTAPAAISKTRYRIRIVGVGIARRLEKQTAGQQARRPPSRATVGIAAPIGFLKPCDKRRHGGVLAFRRGARTPENHLQNRLDRDYLHWCAAHEHDIRRCGQGFRALGRRCVVEYFADVRLGGQCGHGGQQQSRRAKPARAAGGVDSRPSRTGSVGVGPGGGAPSIQLRPERNRH